MNTVTYGGVETAQYPMSIYRTMFRRFFTFVVPLACVTYFPLRDAIDPSGFSLIGMLAPWVGPIFFGLTMGIWKLGLRHYTSTGS
jgi:ABC-2 type transport system permease protein